MTQPELSGNANPYPDFHHPSSAGSYIFSNEAERKRYFQNLKHVIQMGFLIAYLIPISILILFFDGKFNETVRESSKMHLAAVAESQRNTIDLFMQKLIVNVFNLFHLKDFSLEPGLEEMYYYLNNLIKANDAFVDIGFFNPEGIQIGYAGPYPHLLNKDYSDESWYTKLTTQPLSYIISDLYLGMRRMPHFTIGVKQLIDGRYYVIRTSVDPFKLYAFLETTRYGKSVDGFLINTEGKYQVVNREFGELLEPALFIPMGKKTADVVNFNFNGQQVLLAYTWLKEVPWCLVMWQPVDVALKEMENIRKSMIIGTAIMVFALVLMVWSMVNRFINWAGSLEHDKAELKTQLYHTHKLSAVGQLAGGVAHEINNPLAIISSEAGLIRDMLDPSLEMKCTPEAIINELDEIDKAVYRAKTITQKILLFVRKTDPRLELCNLNELLEDVVGGVKEQEFAVSNIELVRNFELDLPKLMLDADMMRQVFLNLINNAGDALINGGVITLSTALDGNWVKISVADDGVGMDSHQVQKIFMPFFTTKEVGKGTGLGLAISLSIVEGFGGHIEVQSKPGAGTTFTVALPVSVRDDSVNNYLTTN